VIIEGGLRGSGSVGSDGWERAMDCPAQAKNDLHAMLGKAKRCT
jgi:hypothetical protein